MWLRSVFALTLVSLPLSAFARGESSDARKWRTLLPAVRATTDCIARGIAESPPALWHARQDNWLEAVKTMKADCSELGHAMVAEHDRLYGAGTGRTFVGGAYATDLPRALKARIGREIERAPPPLADGEQAPAIAPSTAEVHEEAPAPPAPSEPAAEESVPVAAHRRDEATPSAARSESTADRPDALAGISNAPAPLPVRLADEPRLDRPLVPASFWLVCVAALALSLYAALRGLGQGRPRGQFRSIGRADIRTFLHRA